MLAPSDAVVLFGVGADGAFAHAGCAALFSKYVRENGGDVVERVESVDAIAARIEGG